MLKKSIHITLILTFLLTSLGPLPKARAEGVLGLPAPGTMVNLSPAYEPVIIKGLTVHKDNPFLFDFVVDVGQDKMSGAPLKKEGEKLIKYFLAGLAIPDKDVWVNLSPYEKNRMVPEALSQTDMGRDLLEQDYVLKQITASLIYPENNLGREFWDRVYAKAQAMYGTTQVPVNTFNKVWIMADRAEVFEHNQTAFVVDSHLKVMLEEDYLALTKHNNMSSPNALIGDPNTTYTSHSIASTIIRQIILPQLEREVNTGKNFANLRQIFNSIILASWYKRNLKEALLNQVYADKAKIKGINLSDPNVTQQIYEQYLKAYKKGVFNFIKEDVNATGQSMPRKYFSGGIWAAGAAANPAMTTDPAALAKSLPDRAMVDFATLASQKPEEDELLIVDRIRNAGSVEELYDLTVHYPNNPLIKAAAVSRMHQLQQEYDAGRPDKAMSNFLTGALTRHALSQELRVAEQRIQSIYGRLEQAASSNKDILITIFKSLFGVTINPSFFTEDRLLLYKMLNDRIPGIKFYKGLGIMGPRSFIIEGSRYFIDRRANDELAFGLAQAWVMTSIPLRGVSSERKKFLYDQLALFLVWAARFDVKGSLRYIRDQQINQDTYVYRGEYATLNAYNRITALQASIAGYHLEEKSSVETLKSIINNVTTADPAMASTARHLVSRAVTADESARANAQMVLIRRIAATGKGINETLVVRLLLHEIKRIAEDTAYQSQDARERDIDYYLDNLYSALRETGSTKAVELIGSLKGSIKKNSPFYLDKKWPEVLGNLNDIEKDVVVGPVSERDMETALWVMGIIIAKFAGDIDNSNVDGLLTYVKNQDVRNVIICPLTLDEIPSNADILEQGPEQALVPMDVKEAHELVKEQKAKLFFVNNVVLLIDEQRYMAVEQPMEVLKDKELTGFTLRERYFLLQTISLRLEALRPASNSSAQRIGIFSLRADDPQIVKYMYPAERKLLILAYVMKFFGPDVSVTTNLLSHDMYIDRKPDMDLKKIVEEMEQELQRLAPAGFGKKGGYASSAAMLTATDKAMASASTERLIQEARYTEIRAGILKAKKAVANILLRGQGKQKKWPELNGNWHEIHHALFPLLAFNIKELNDLYSGLQAALMHDPDLTEEKNRRSVLALFNAVNGIFPASDSKAPNSVKVVTKPSPIFSPSFIIAPDVLYDNQRFWRIADAYPGQIIGRTFNFSTRDSDSSIRLTVTDINRKIGIVGTDRDGKIIRINNGLRLARLATDHAMTASISFEKASMVPSSNGHLNTQQALVAFDSFESMLASYRRNPKGIRDRYFYISTEESPEPIELRVSDVYDSFIRGTDADGHFISIARYSFIGAEGIVKSQETMEKDGAPADILGHETNAAARMLRKNNEAALLGQLSGDDYWSLVMTLRFRRGSIFRGRDKGLQFETAVALTQPAWEKFLSSEERQRIVQILNDNLMVPKNTERARKALDRFEGSPATAGLSDQMNKVISEWIVSGGRNTGTEQKQMRAILSQPLTDLDRLELWIDAVDALAHESKRFESVTGLYKFLGRLPGMGIWLARMAQKINDEIWPVKGANQHIDIILKTIKKLLVLWGRDYVFTFDVAPRISFERNGYQKPEIGIRFLLDGGHLAQDNREEISKMLRGEYVEETVSSESVDYLSVVVPPKEKEKKPAESNKPVSRMPSIDGVYRNRFSRAKAWSLGEKGINLIVQYVGPGNQLGEKMEVNKRIFLRNWEKESDAAMISLPDEIISPDRVLRLAGKKIPQGILQGELQGKITQIPGNSIINGVLEGFLKSRSVDILVDHFPQKVGPGEIGLWWYEQRGLKKMVVLSRVMFIHMIVSLSEEKDYMARLLVTDLDKTLTDAQLGQAATKRLALWLRPDQKKFIDDLQAGHYFIDFDSIPFVYVDSIYNNLIDFYIQSTLQGRALELGKEDKNVSVENVGLFFPRMYGNIDSARRISIQPGYLKALIADLFEIDPQAATRFVDVLMQLPMDERVKKLHAKLDPLTDRELYLISTWLSEHEGRIELPHQLGSSIQEFLEERNMRQFHHYPKRLDPRCALFFPDWVGGSWGLVGTKNIFFIMLAKLDLEAPDLFKELVVELTKDNDLSEKLLEFYARSESRERPKNAAMRAKASDLAMTSDEVRIQDKEDKLITVKLVRSLTDVELPQAPEKGNFTRFGNYLNKYLNFDEYVSEPGQFFLWWYKNSREDQVLRMSKESFTRMIADLLDKNPSLARILVSELAITSERGIGLAAHDRFDLINDSLLNKNERYIFGVTNMEFSIGDFFASSDTMPLQLLYMHSFRNSAGLYGRFKVISKSDRNAITIKFIDEFGNPQWVQLRPASFQAWVVDTFEYYQRKGDLREARSILIALFQGTKFRITKEEQVEAALERIAHLGLSDVLDEQAKLYIQKFSRQLALTVNSIPPSLGSAMQKNFFIFHMDQSKDEQGTLFFEKQGVKWKFKGDESDYLLMLSDLLEKDANTFVELIEKKGVGNFSGVRSLFSDSAMASSTPGGIDLNTSGMQWTISKDGHGVEMHIDPAAIARIREQGIDSLSPVVLRMTTVTDIWSWAGLTKN